MGQFDLDPYEVGSLGLAVLFKVVGVDEADGVVVGVVEDGLEESFALNHRTTACYPGRNRPPPPGQVTTCDLPCQCLPAHNPRTKSTYARFGPFDSFFSQ
jgi:hypothetical protein